MADLDEERAKLLAVFHQKVATVLRFPIRRRIIPPDDFRNMFNPLRTRRDYTSLGRPTFLVTELPDE